MPRGNPLSKSQKDTILRLREESYTHQKIGQIVGCCRTAVTSLLQRAKEPNGLESRRKIGPKRMTSDREDRRLHLMHMKSRGMTDVQLAKAWGLTRMVGENAHTFLMCRSTVRRRLLEAGLRNRAKVKKVTLNSRQRKLRFEFCKRYEHWTVHDWRTVLFSDECNLNVEPSGGQRKVWRKPHERHQRFAIREVKKHRPTYAKVP